jgi:CRP/FNR family transcriptional regulator, anaerobic regulatory protein
MRAITIKAAWNGHSDCQSCGIRESVLFAELVEADFALLHDQIDDIDYPPGAALYHAGANGDWLFTLRAGAIKLVRYNADGSQRILRILRRGDICGLEVLVGSAYDHTAITLSPVKLCRIPRVLIERLNRDTPRLQKPLFERWHAALEEADAWLTELAAGHADVKTRVARLLCRLGNDGEPGLVTRLSLEDIGAALGVAPESASRALGLLRRSNLLSDVPGDRHHWRADMRGLAVLGSPTRED